MITRRGALAVLLGLGGAATAGMVAGCGGRTAETPGGVVRSVEAYGSAPLQSGEWFVPADGDRLPVVVLVHGGFWQPGYDRHLEDEVAQSLAADGFAVWNIDYALADTEWPATLLDAATAMDHVTKSQLTSRLDLARVAVVGHSAGGHLALWLASRGELPPGTPGASPGVRATVAVGQAPVADLVAAAQEGVGSGAVEELVDGRPEDVPDRYAVSSPQALLPVRGVHITLVHGDADDLVPLRQSTAYAEAARAAGMHVSTRVLEGVGHFEHLDPATEAVAAMRAALEDL
ncbi:MAG: alpha/beta hydrolase [Sporichthyaceae bacterium]